MLSNAYLIVCSLHVSAEYDILNVKNVCKKSNSDLVYVLSKIRNFRYVKLFNFVENLMMIYIIT